MGATSSRRHIWTDDDLGLLVEWDVHEGFRYVWQVDRGWLKEEYPAERLASVVALLIARGLSDERMISPRTDPHGLIRAFYELDLTGYPHLVEKRDVLLTEARDLIAEREARRQARKRRRHRSEGDALAE